MALKRLSDLLTNFSTTVGNPFSTQISSCDLISSLVKLANGTPSSFLTPFSFISVMLNNLMLSIKTFTFVELPIDIIKPNRLNEEKLLIIDKEPLFTPKPLPIA